MAQTGDPHARPLQKDPVYRLLDFIIPLIQIYGFYVLIIGTAIYFLWPKINRLDGLGSSARAEDLETVERKRREAWAKKQEELERIVAEKKAERERELEAQRAIKAALDEAARAAETMEAQGAAGEADSSGTSEVSSLPTPKPAPKPDLPPAQAVREAWNKKPPASASPSPEDAKTEAASEETKAESAASTSKAPVTLPEASAASAGSAASTSSAPALSGPSSSQPTIVRATEPAPTPIPAPQPSSPSTSRVSGSPASSSDPAIPRHHHPVATDPYADRPPPPIYFDCPESCGLVTSTLFGSDSETEPTQRGNSTTSPFRILWTPGAFRTVEGGYAQPTLFKIIAFGGLYLDGLEFHFRDYDIVRVGKTDGEPAAQIMINHGDYVRRLYVRSGAWVDGFGIVISGGREVSFFGEVRKWQKLTFHLQLPWVGGSGGQFHEFEPPEGTRIVGLYGFAGPKGIDGLGAVCAPVVVKP